MKTKMGIIAVFIIGMFTGVGVGLSPSMSTVFAAKPVKVEVEKADARLIINGKNAIDRPIIISGTSYLPLRTIAEVFNFDVDWDMDSRTVIVTERKVENDEN